MPSSSHNPLKCIVRFMTLLLHFQDFVILKYLLGFYCKKVNELFESLAWLKGHYYMSVNEQINCLRQVNAN